MLETAENITNASSLNGLSLAFLGDSVYEVMVREYLLKNGSTQVAKLQKSAVSIVRASAQAHFYDIIEPLLNEDEHSILLRGRNTNSTHIPKSAKAIEYRKATGIEALFGWLYLNGNNERLREIFNIIIENVTDKVSQIE